MIRVSDILSGSMEKYLLNHKLSFKQRKVINKIINCYSENSPELIFECTNNDCDYTELKKKPCQDRHCNRCNSHKKIKWVIKLLKDFVHLPYYHVVFTLPSELDNLSICNQEIIYDIFFKSCFYVLTQFASDKKYFGGKIGYIGLLHTWGQRLNYHPHIHFIVLSGGIINGIFKRLPYYKDFIFPVKAMSKVMMGKFTKLLKAKYYKGELKFPGKLQSISSDQKFNNYLYLLSTKEWVSYSKKPFANSDNLLEYISRYTHRVAISNNRIKSYQDGKVTFEFLDYKNKDKYEIPQKDILTLSDTEFIRRYLLHILPDGFRKIRYGGIFSSNQKSESVCLIKQSIRDSLENINSRIDKLLEELKLKLNIYCPLCSWTLIPQKIQLQSGYG